MGEECCSILSTREWGQKNGSILLSPFSCRSVRWRWNGVSNQSRGIPPVPEGRPTSDPGRAPLPGRWGASAEPPTNQFLVAMGQICRRATALVASNHPQLRFVEGWRFG